MAIHIQYTKKSTTEAEPVQPEALYEVVYAGDLKGMFGVNVSCYILDDPLKTPVLTYPGLTTLLGFAGAGADTLLKFLLEPKIRSLCSPQLKDCMTNPLKFISKGGSKPTSTDGHNIAVVGLICSLVNDAQISGASSTHAAPWLRRVRAIQAALVTYGLTTLAREAIGAPEESQLRRAQFKAGTEAPHTHTPVYAPQRCKMVGG